MELVYLWVEGYKNIQKQGFNFSPRFECSYDEKTNELTIDEKEDYVSIFPENINVTAIVGKNGSGKSSILEMISNKHEDSNYKYSKKKIKFFSIYFSDNLYIANDNYIDTDNMDYSNIKCDDIIIINNANYICGSLEKNSNKFEKVVSLFYSDILNSLSINLKNREWKSNTPYPKNISTASMLNNIKPTRKREFNYGDYSKTGFQKVYQSYEIHQIILSLMLIKKGMTLPLSVPKELFVKNIDFFEHLHSDDDKLKKELFNIKLKYTNNKDKSEFLKALEKNIIIGFMLSVERLGTESYEEKNTNITSLLTNMTNSSFIEIINKIIHSYTFTFSNDDKPNLLKKIKKFIEKVNTIEQNYLIDNILTLNIEKLDIEFINLYKEIVFYIEHFLDFSWSKQLSSGEESFLYQFARFRYYLEDFKQNSTPFTIKADNLIVLIDEGELTLHPSWQKDYVKNYIEFFTKNKLAKTVQLILTSHSPFILSDLPKENIIFLKNDKNGNGENVSKEVDIKPFGANIHTLLSHGFFMQDGLMGEFAKSKIEEIKNFYDKVKKSENPQALKDEYLQKVDDFKNIHKIIGEPFLKTVIGNYLDELEQTFDQDNYQEKQKEKLLSQFTKEELLKHLDSLND